nr:xanthine phosphoribosyltransferase [Clostridia bacterium]
MKLLCDKILSDGEIRPGGIVKVDNFLNHQIDVGLLNELGKEFHRMFAHDGITKILTVEASGIAIAGLAALHFGVPLVFAKKHQTSNIDSSTYSAQVESFTHKTVYQIRVAQKFISPDDHILIIDDFLANGNAVVGMIDIVKSAGASVAGVGICIEKGFQPGGKLIRDMGIKLRSLAIVNLDENGGLTLSDDVE